MGAVARQHLHLRHPLVRPLLRTCEDFGSGSSMDVYCPVPVSRNLFGHSSRGLDRLQAYMGLSAESLAKSS